MTRRILLSDYFYQVGGYVARDRGWRWCFWVGAILNGVIFIFALLFMPETIFDRPHEYTDIEILGQSDDIEGERPNSLFSGNSYAPPSLSMKAYMRRLCLWDLDKPSTRQLKAKDFVVKPLSMLKYPSVAFPALY